MTFNDQDLFLPSLSSDFSVFVDVSVFLLFSSPSIINPLGSE